MTTKSQTDNTELGEIFAKHGILPPNSNPAYYGSHISIVEPVYAELLSEIAKLLKEQDIKSRIDELLGADDEVRLHNTVGESYQDWFTERLAKLIKEQSVTEQTNKKCDLLYCCSGLKPLGHNEPVATAGAVQTRQTTTSELGEIFSEYLPDVLSMTNFAERVGENAEYHTDEPLNRLMQAIEQKYIRRDLVIEAIGKNEKKRFEPADNYKVNNRNQLRKEIRQTLNLQSKEK